MQHVQLDLEVYHIIVIKFRHGNIEVTHKYGFKLGMPLS
jgi:hypothetical protein